MNISSNDTAVLIEEKIYCNASIADDFADDRVLVVLKNQASVTLDSYDESDFADIACTKVSNLTQSSTEIVQYKLKGEDVKAVSINESSSIVFNDFQDIDTDSFHQVLCLGLNETGKDKVLATIKILMERDDVLYAGPDYKIVLSSKEPNDPLYDDQWASEKIQLPQAWDTTTGASTVMVGILDSGIDGTHPDLVNRINVSASRDFTNGITELVSSVSDPYGHGTLVAGVVAAQGNNSVGISGVAWNTTLVSLRVFTSNGGSYSSYVASAIDYATRAGIPILNFSGNFQSSSVYYDEALENVIGNYPGLLVGSAGNDNRDMDLLTAYPVGYVLDNFISVGGTYSTDAKMQSSNYGKATIDLFAPGDNILTCYPRQKCAPAGCGSSACVQYGYHINGGTSLAAPFVTGVAALILAKNPSSTPQQIKEVILASVDKVSGLSNLCVSGGRLNAYKAVHSHAYTYTSLNATKHTCNCSCGYSHTENHSWTTISTNDASTNATIRTCGKCGYSKTVLS